MQKIYSNKKANIIRFFLILFYKFILQIFTFCVYFLLYNEQKVLWRRILAHIKFNCYTEDVHYLIAKAMRPFLKKDMAIMCIGSDLYIGDAFGPLVGTFLANNVFLENRVYGTLKTPITSKNISEVTKKIQAENPDTPVLVIDAMISRNLEVGDIIVMDNGISPGLGVKKMFPRVGDVSLTCVVSNDEIDYLNSIKDMRLNTVFYMAQIASKALLLSMGLSYNLQNQLKTV